MNHKATSEMKAVFNAGFVAAKAGFPVATNPYLPNSVGHGHWNAGHKTGLESRHFAERLTFACISVLGGWQTQIVETKELIGPVFNKVNDLWAWQGKYLKNE